MTRKTQTLKKVKSQNKSKSQLRKTRKVLKHRGGIRWRGAVKAISRGGPRTKRLSNYMPHQGLSGVRRGNSAKVTEGVLTQGHLKLLY